MKSICIHEYKNLVILGLAVTAASLESFIAEPLQYMYAYPSARVAGLFWGITPVMTEQSEVLISMANQWINVTSKCSAFGFSCLLCAILIINILRLKSNSKRMIGILFACPIAYALTIIVNGCRIVSGYYAHKIGQMILPENFQPTIHMGVGIIIFLSTLIGVTLIFERMNDAEQARN